MAGTVLFYNPSLSIFMDRMYQHSDFLHVDILERTVAYEATHFDWVHRYDQSRANLPRPAMNASQSRGLNRLKDQSER